VNAKQFLKENQLEALKKIGIWLGKDIKFNYANEPYYVEGIRRIYFKPLTNAEQWIECQNLYRNNLVDMLIGQQTDTEFYRMMFLATASRESLLIAILDLVDGVNA